METSRWKDVQLFINTIYNKYKKYVQLIIKYTYVQIYKLKLILKYQIIPDLVKGGV